MSRNIEYELHADKIVEKPRKSQWLRVMAACAGVVVPASLVLVSNCSNVKVDGGYAAYVYSDPIFGKKEFLQVMSGPNSTGWVWRQKACIISVTPWRMAESFDNIQSSDNLMTAAEASIVFKVDISKIKEFVEQYGAMAEVGTDPVEIIKDAYESFIQKPFQTSVRNAISQYRGLDAAKHIPDITSQVHKDMQTMLKDTPFMLQSVNIGRTTPPKEVVAGIVAKVEATQTDEKRDIELSIARKNEEIKEAEGRAEARKVAQQAEGERQAAKSRSDAELYAEQRKADAELYKAQKDAEARLLIAEANSKGKKLEAEAVKQYSDSVGDNYVKLQFVQNLDKLKMPTTMVGSDLLNNVIDAAGGLINK